MVKIEIEFPLWPQWAARRPEIPFWLSRQWAELIVFLLRRFIYLKQLIETIIMTYYGTVVCLVIYSSPYVYVGGETRVKKKDPRQSDKSYNFSVELMKIASLVLIPPRVTLTENRKRITPKQIESKTESKRNQEEKKIRSENQKRRRKRTQWEIQYLNEIMTQRTVTGYSQSTQYWINNTVRDLMDSFGARVRNIDRVSGSGHGS